MMIDGSNSSASSDVHATVYNDTLKNKIEKKMVELAHIVCLEASLKPIHASKVAASIIFIARELNGVRRNSTRMQELFGYTIHELSEIINKIRECIVKQNQTNANDDDIICVTKMLQELSSPDYDNKGTTTTGSSPSPNGATQIKKEAISRSSPCSVMNGVASPTK